MSVPLQDQLAIRRGLVVPLAAVAAVAGGATRFWCSGMAWPVITTYARLVARRPRTELDPIG